MEKIGYEEQKGGRINERYRERRNHRRNEHLLMTKLQTLSPIIHPCEKHIKKNGTRQSYSGGR